VSQGEFADDQDDKTQQAAYLEEGQEEVKEEKDAKEKFTGEAKEGITDGDGEEDAEEESEEETSGSSSDEESASEDEDEVDAENADDEYATTKKKKRRKKNKPVSMSTCVTQPVHCSQTVLLMIACD